PRQYLHDLADLVRDRPPRPRAVRPPRLAPGPPRRRRGRPLRERRRLPLRGSARRLELLLQLVPLALEPVAFSLQAVAILAQPFELALQPLVLFPQPLLLAPLFADPPLQILPRRSRHPPRCRHRGIRAWYAKKIQRPGESIHAEGANQRRFFRLCGAAHNRKYADPPIMLSDAGRTAA